MFQTLTDAIAIASFVTKFAAISTIEDTKCGDLTTGMKYATESLQNVNSKHKILFSSPYKTTLTRN